MNKEVCDLCGNAGSLRDGSPCPRCALSPRVERIDTIAETRPKRMAWFKAEPRVVPRDVGGFVRQRGRQ